MTRNELLVKIANAGEADPILAQIDAALQSDGGSEMLTATEACQLLKISRSTLWRHFPPSLKIGALPRWRRSALLAGGGAK